MAKSFVVLPHVSWPSHLEFQKMWPKLCYATTLMIQHALLTYLSICQQSPDKYGWIAAAFVLHGTEWQAPDQRRSPRSMR